MAKDKTTVPFSTSRPRVVYHAERVKDDKGVVRIVPVSSPSFSGRSGRIPAATLWGDRWLSSRRALGLPDEDLPDYLRPVCDPIRRRAAMRRFGHDSNHDRRR